VSDIDTVVVDSLKVLDPDGRLEKKHEPVSDIDTVVVDSLKVLDPDGRLEKRPNCCVAANCSVVPGPVPIEKAPVRSWASDRQKGPDA